MNKKFWINNLKELFTIPEIIPNKKHCIEKQLNSVTRMVLLIFIILIIFDIKISILFLAPCFLVCMVFSDFCQNKKVVHFNKINFWPRFTWG